MLVIRMQRSGRKGHAMFRVVVQDSRRTPTSGKLVAQLGSYDPHAKAVIIDAEKTQFYLEHGAQPSDRVARLLSKEGVKLPKWVVMPDQKQGAIRNVDKRRSTRPEAPAEEVAEEPAAPAADETVPESPEVETPAAETTEEAAAEPEAPAEEASEEVAEEAPAEEEKPAEESAEEPEATPEPAEEEAAEETAPEAPAEEPEATPEPSEPETAEPDKTPEANTKSE
jgi:small subunit ribosomal protein S16